MSDDREALNRAWATVVDRMAALVPNLAGDTDSPFPGAIRCPVCWDGLGHGRFTATYHRMTHRDRACGRFCMKVGIGAHNVRAVAERLGPAVEQYRGVMDAEPNLEDINP